MKKIILISMILIFNACVGKRNSALYVKSIIKSSKDLKKLTLNDFKGDTLKYVQTKILDNKAYYIGKKFEVLLADLNIPVYNYLYSADFNNIKNVSGVTFEIYNRYITNKKLEKGEIPVNLVVAWSPPISSETLEKVIGGRSNRGKWTPKIEAFFKEQIVGDVVRTDYHYENTVKNLPPPNTEFYERKSH